MFTTDINFWLVLLGAVIWMALGALWYSPALFGKAWMELTGAKEEDLKGNTKAYIGAFIIGLITTFVLALFVYQTDAQTAVEGAGVGFWAWLGFVAAVGFSGVIWEKLPLKLFFIHIVPVLAAFLINGAILAVWG